MSRTVQVGFLFLLSVLGVAGQEAGNEGKGLKPETMVSELTRDPFLVPPEMADFFRLHTANGLLPTRLQSILTATFGPSENGFLGMQYDNDATRTVAEVWRDRRANCLSLTAFFVAACHSVGIRAQYAEALNTLRWTRVRGIIRKERHVVALGEHRMGGEDLVADFLPSMQRRVGFYTVRPVAPKAFLALFHANRAVEALDRDNLGLAQAHAQLAVETDPENSSGWNILGVVKVRSGNIQEGEALYRKAMQIDPKDTSALGNLEALLRVQGREGEAQKMRDLSLQVRKRDPYFQYFLAQEAFEAGDLVEAEKKIKSAIRLHRRESEFHLLRARVCLLKGDMEGAQEALASAQKWASPTEQARYANKMEALKRSRDTE